MSRLLVASDDLSATVEIGQDDGENPVPATCRACPWTYLAERADGQDDAINEAGIHVDTHHSGGSR